MDYPTQSRLKLLGHVEVREGADAQQLIGELSGPGVRALVERALVIRIEAFDWNCQQYITPRYSQDQVIEAMAPIRQRLAQVEEENKRLRAELEQVVQK
jgi:hypothetical protein